MTDQKNATAKTQAKDASSAKHIPSAKAGFANVYEALSYVMASVSYVQKEASRDLPYTIKTESGVIAAIRPFMVEAGLVMLPTRVDNLQVVTSQRKQVKRGQETIKAVTKTTGVFTYVLVHAPSSTQVEIQVVGEGDHDQDKSVYLAMTGSKKYALLHAFLLETGDDPDYPQNNPGYNDDLQDGGSVSQQQHTDGGDQVVTLKEIEMWNQLVATAEGFGIVVLESPPDGVLISELRRMYAELYHQVEQAQMGGPEQPDFYPEEE